MQKKVIEVENLVVSYGRTRAVKDISFRVDEGEIFAIIGPNGSGKTSTIECMGGLRKPTNGEIKVFGLNPATNRKTLYKKIGIQLQDVQYPEKIKMKELCELFAAFYENPADWQKLLEQFGLNEKKNRMVKNLSGGERQRLSILLALLPRPKLLFLDELTTGLDPEVRHGIWKALKVIKKTGVSIVLISHYLDEVDELADRFMYLVNGSIEFSGTPLAFAAYAKGKVPQDKWQDSLTLEEIYLLISPPKTEMNLEGIV